MRFEVTARVIPVFYTWNAWGEKKREIKYETSYKYFIDGLEVKKENFEAHFIIESQKELE